MTRVLAVLLAVVFPACRPSSGSDQPTEGGSGDSSSKRAPVASSWRVDTSSSRIEDVAIDGRGRVAVVGQRLVGAGKRARSSVFVSLYEVDGTLAWTETIEGERWQQAAAILATDEGVTVAARSGDAGDDTSVVVAYGPDGGGPLWLFRRDLGTREHPQDLALDGDRLVVAVATPNLRGEPGSVALWLDPLSGLPLAEAKLEATVTCASSTLDGVALFTLDEPKAHKTAFDGEQPLFRERDLVLEEPWSSEPTSDGGVVVAGWPSDDEDAEPIVRFTRDGSVRWASGYRAFDQMVPNAVAVGRNDSIYAAGGPEWVALDPDGNTVASHALGDHDSIAALATGPGGSLALVGYRYGDAYGHTDGFVIRLDRPEAPSSLPSTLSRSKMSAGELPIATRLRWLESPRAGHELLLPKDRPTRREAAKALLVGDLACVPTLVDTTPDTKTYAPRSPGPLSTIDDPCLLVASAVSLLPALHRDDFPKVREGLLSLLQLHDDDVDGGEELGRALLDAAASSGYAEDVARLALDASSVAVREYAVDVLEDRTNPRAVKVLESFVERADCSTAMRAALALEARGLAEELASRPRGATTTQLYRRYCLLRHHPDPKLADAYWKQLVGPSGCYEWMTTCEGSWPTDSDLLEPCEEDVERICEAPGSIANDASPKCRGNTCRIGSERSLENFNIGWDATAQFLEGRDGELYLDSLEVLHWIR